MGDPGKRLAPVAAARLAELAAGQGQLARAGVGAEVERAALVAAVEQLVPVAAGGQAVGQVGAGVRRLLARLAHLGPALLGQVQHEHDVGEEGERLVGEHAPGPADHRALVLPHPGPPVAVADAAQAEPGGLPDERVLALVTAARVQAGGRRLRVAAAPPGGADAERVQEDDAGVPEAALGDQRERGLGHAGVGAQERAELEPLRDRRLGPERHPPRDEGGEPAELAGERVVGITGHRRHDPAEDGDVVRRPLAPLLPGVGLGVGEEV